MWLFMTMRDAARLGLGVGPVGVLDERAEDRHVGHLPADQAGLGLGAAEVGGKLGLEALLD